MTVSTIEDLQGWDNRHVLKFTRGSLFIADYEGVTDVTNPFTMGTTPDTAKAVSLAALPTDFNDPGYLTTDGVSFSRNISVSDVMSWQSQEPVNSTVETDVMTFKANFQETNPVTLALSDNLLLANKGDFSAVYQQERSQSGEQPLRKVLFIAEALDVAAPIWAVRYFPQVKITAVDDEQYARTQETQYPFTFTAYKDTAFGASGKRWVGGPGWNAFAA